MMKLAKRLTLLGLALTLMLAVPTSSDACCWGWRGCGWRGGCGWGGGCGWRSCGWGGCGPAWGCTWGGGCGWGCGSPVVISSWGGPCCSNNIYGTTIVASSYRPMLPPIYQEADAYISPVLADPPLLVTRPRTVISPRYVQPTSRPVNVPSSVPSIQPPAEAIPAPAEATSSRIEVRVPTADAEVYFGGHKTKMTGLKRTFETPALKPGKSYHYQVAVKWKDADGRELEDRYKLEVSAGKQAVVAFGERPGDTSSWVANRIR